MKKIVWIGAAFYTTLSFSAAQIGGPKGGDHAPRALEKKSRPTGQLSSINDIPPVPDKLVSPLIPELGAEGYAARNKAEKALIALGEGVLTSPVFKAALDSPDLEVKRRVEAVKTELMKPFAPLSQIDFLFCLTRMMKQSPDTEAMRQLVKVVKPLAKRHWAHVEKLNPRQPKSYGPHNEALDFLFAEAKKSLNADGVKIGTVKLMSFDALEDGIQRKGLYLMRLEKDGLPYYAVFSGEMFMVVCSPERDLNASLDGTNFPGAPSKIDLSGDPCHLKRRLPMSELLPKELKPGVLAKSDFNAAVSTSLKPGGGTWFGWSVSEKGASIMGDHPRLAPSVTESTDTDAPDADTTSVKNFLFDQKGPATIELMNKDIFFFKD